MGSRSGSPMKRMEIQEDQGQNRRDQLMATHLLRRMGMERRMPMEMIEDNLRDSSKGIFSIFTCKLFTRFPSVFNLVIILRSTHIYQVYKTFCRNNKLFQSGITNVRERRNTGG